MIKFSKLLANKIKLSKQEILNDYYLINESRNISLIGRKEVFMGRAKFGVFGDGKELPQIAMSKVFKNGDIRSGYYRDQTFMMAIDQLNSEQFFAQLYANTDISKDPHSGGRQMNSHFATRMLNNKGEWKTLTDIKNSSSDVSCVAGQMPRLVGLAYASKLYRKNKELKNYPDFSVNGNEIAFGTIGNAATSEGHFWEAINAAGVLQIPFILSIWDDDYFQYLQSIIQLGMIYQKLQKGLEQRKNDKENGFELFEVYGWDYIGLIDAYINAEKYARKHHVKCIVHVKELTQPQGHTTSGSHERYKSKERLKWERNNDCIKMMRKWILENQIADENELDKIENKAVLDSKKKVEI